MPEDSKPEDCAERTDAGEVARAIDEELADHLAQAATELASGGHPPESAARLALEQFGDVRRTARQCWWIQQGDQVMRRYVSIGLVVVFVLVTAGFIFPLIGKLRDGQQAMAADIQEVAARFESLNDAQQKLLEQTQAGQVLEIKGRAYLGDPAKPVPGVEIQLVRMPSKEVYRRLRTRDDGTFTSEALPPGDYALLAELVGDTNWAKLIVQSQPIYLYHGERTPVVDLNLYFPAGQVSLDLSRTLPDRNKVGDYLLSCQPRISIYSRLLELPLSPAHDASTSVDWPIIGVPDGGYGPLFFTQLTPNKAMSLIRMNYHPGNRPPTPYDTWWPEGRYHVMMQLSIIDSDGKSFEGTLGGYSISREFDVREGRRVNLRVHVPESLGPRLRELLEKLRELLAKDERSEQEIKQVRALLPTLEVVSTTPIPEPSKDELTP